LHHVIGRGIERREIFTDDVDRDDFVSRLSLLLAETKTLCYAWALIPSHFHLLLRTGTTPLSMLMRRLLTGYAVAFNRRHQRSGHLFQNRYKSIICQEEPYLLELVRYIHLNPLRAGLVTALDALAGCAYSGHRQLLGLTEQGFVAVDDVLALFGKEPDAARKNYAAFIADGVDQGNRPELVGGGLLRSRDGSLRRTSIPVDEPMASDERILGEGDFVAAVLHLQQAEAHMTARRRYQAVGFGLVQLAALVAELLEIEPAQVKAPGKQSERVRARSLYCYWAVRELGHSTTELARELGISQPAVSQTMRRGEFLAAERGWTLSEQINL
jgi:REP element-mobilizing transposase RayT/DNA-binding CsgD family transcriptional regulator